MNNLTQNIYIDIEQEDQSPDAQLIYQAVSEQKISYWLEHALAQLILILSQEDSIESKNYPDLVKKIFYLFTHFYIAIIFVPSSKSQALNNQYRHKNYPTNILSFPSPIPIDFYQTLPKEEQQFTLGDLIIDLEVLEQEAKTQHKSLEHHFAHILIHGLLHLLSFDHETSHEAAIMETLEAQLLHKMDIPNPYIARSNFL